MAFTLIYKIGDKIVIHKEYIKKEYYVKK